ncbi:TRAP transporter small permease subunit [bacterium]|nr:TRAP transporter small permease subunit [bacterium]
MSLPPQAAPRRWVDMFEQTAIALLLGLMTLITFVNVVLRYGFNSGFIWGLEATLILFSWLVIYGVSHAFRVTANLGVDALTNALPPRPRRLAALASAVCCLLYALLMLKGAWDYWAPFAGLKQTTGRWFPTGLDAATRDRAFYITEQIPMPHFLDFLSGWINQGEAYEKLPRVIPYLILPLGIGLILLRLIEATRDILTGKRESLIVSHEAEDAVESVAALNREG